MPVVLGREVLSSGSATRTLTVVVEAGSMQMSCWVTRQMRLALAAGLAEKVTVLLAVLMFAPT